MLLSVLKGFYISELQSEFVLRHIYLYVKAMSGFFLYFVTLYQISYS